MGGRDRWGVDATAAAGRWEVLFETGDQTELLARLRRLHVEEPDVDDALIRIDTLCGRLVHPTTYRLSRFFPAAGPDTSPVTLP